MLSPKSFTPPLLILLTAHFISCTARDDAFHEWNIDPVIGTRYQPQIQTASQAHPKKILILPLAGHAPADSKQAFLSAFLSQINHSPHHQAITWPVPTSATSTSLPPMNENTALSVANSLQCDAILLLEVHHHRFMPPQHIQASFTIESVNPITVIASGNGSYDASNKTVATAARAYSKNHNSYQPPYDSTEILHNRLNFSRFAGHNLASHLSTSLAPPILLPANP